MVGDKPAVIAVHAANGKRLDIENTGSANGTRIQIWTCNSSPARTWQFNLRATTSIKNVGSGKCLDLHTH
ncbi:RICIN domain-containing protein [Streptomyces sp. NPDC093093]|uniref:RICIN domain-containing protein n=1 Tax=Streptomyces sp. NPDC093093 TaxID=3366025 RepID=UPI0037F46DC7